jgi:glutathione S-transferase
MTGIHLYHFFLSNCAQRVSLTLAEKGLELTPHYVNLIAKENTKDDYFRINPTGLVPALVHDSMVITESIDILRYLEEQFPEPPLYPSGMTARRQVDDWMDEATNNHNGVIKIYMYALVFGGEKSPGEMRRYLENQKEDLDLAEFSQRASAGFSDAQIVAAERDLFALFDRLESELGQHRWLVGSVYSYADIAWFVQHFLMWRTGVINFVNYPNIRRWAAEVMRRSSFERGIKQLQPWYSPIACKALMLRSRVRRGGPMPKLARAGFTKL